MYYRKLLTFGLTIAFAATVYLGQALEPWIFMWALSFKMFIFFKWITYAHHPTSDQAVRYPLLYLFGWVGMDTGPFARERQMPNSSEKDMLLGGCLNLSVGVILIFLTKYFGEKYWLLQAWVACVGLALFLHFGIFKLLAWAYRSMGFDVEPIMQMPLAAKSVSEFWGGRWNRAFKQLVFPFVYYPLKKRIGSSGAVVTTFLVSGLIHELAISLPAGDGWGLPTIYFLIQPLAMFFEKSSIYKKLSGRNHRMFTYVVVAGPAIILFHPPFMKNVILPFLNSIRLLI